MKLKRMLVLILAVFLILSLSGCLRMMMLAPFIASNSEATAYVTSYAVPDDSAADISNLPNEFYISREAGQGSWGAQLYTQSFDLYADAAFSIVMPLNDGELKLSIADKTTGQTVYEASDTKQVNDRITLPKGSYVLRMSGVINAGTLRIVRVTSGTADV